MPVQTLVVILAAALAGNLLLLVGLLVLVVRRPAHEQLVDRNVDRPSGLPRPPAGGNRVLAVRFAGRPASPSLAPQIEPFEPFESFEAFEPIESREPFDGLPGFPDHDGGSPVAAPAISFVGLDVAEMDDRATYGFGRSMLPEPSEPEPDEPPDGGVETMRSGPPRRFPVMLHHDPHAGRAIEAFFSEPIALGPGAFGAVAEEEVVAEEEPAEDLVDSRAVGSSVRWRRRVAGPRVAPGRLPPGLAGPAEWEEVVRIEDARLARYRRPVAIVLGSLEGLVAFADRFGADAAERLALAVGDAFLREARSADCVAWLGGPRFAVLLAETDGVGGTQYLERVRSACAAWLDAASVPVRLWLGCATPPASGGIDAAIRLAETCLHDDRRSSRRRAGNPIAAAPRAGRR